MDFTNHSFPISLTGLLLIHTCPLPLGLEGRDHLVMWEGGEARRTGPCWVLRVVRYVVFCAHSLPTCAGEEGNAQDSVSTEVPPGDEQREGLDILVPEAAEPTAQATPGCLLLLWDGQGSPSGGKEASPSFPPRATRPGPAFRL